MELIALGYLGSVFWLLKGTTPAQKRWIGGMFSLLIAIFVIGSLWIRYQTGFFHFSRMEWYNTDGSIPLGKWAVPWYIVFVLLLLLLILFRFIQKIKTMPANKRWLPFVLAVFFTLVYLSAAYFSLFFVAFLFFPFAP
ncbi:hypothetical protein [Saccharococcus thermophilus]|uniref:Uncharacterized protein n=1 Tax=Saccharococcus thermophilus TaxID=29396 RepID=A0A846MEE0_9BACL|nr:hypothetical protein [Saccharococcus thermophilus]NIK14937.1 hypothetical protein [Saccharococcus thermophilus]